MDMKKRILNIITLAFCFGWLIFVVANLDKATVWLEKFIQKDTQITLEEKMNILKMILINLSKIRMILFL